MNSKYEYLQKTNILKENQESLFKKISKQCTPDNFSDKHIQGNSEIKHFKINNNAHVYCVSGKTPSRLLSTTELPDITYIPSCNKALVPDSNSHNINGNFIMLTPSLVSYVSYDNGKQICNCGYTYSLTNPKKTLFFCSFNNEQIMPFNELPNSATSLLELLNIKARRNKTLSDDDRYNISNIIRDFHNLECLQELEIETVIVNSKDITIETPEKKESTVIATSKENSPILLNSNEFEVSNTSSIQPISTEPSIEQDSVSISDSTKSKREEFVNSLKADSPKQNNNIIKKMKNFFSKER